MTDYNVVTNGKFANDQFAPWESGRISNPEFRPDDGNGRSLLMPPATYIAQELIRPTESRRFKVRCTFKAHIEPPVPAGTKIIAQVTMGTQKGPVIDSIVFDNLHDGWSTYRIIGACEFPDEFKGWAVTIFNGLPGTSDLPPILITDIELLPLYLEGE